MVLAVVLIVLCVVCSSQGVQLAKSVLKRELKEGEKFDVLRRKKVHQMTGIVTFVIGKIVFLSGMLIYIPDNKLFIISSYLIAMFAFYAGNYYYNCFSNDVYVVANVPSVGTKANKELLKLI